MKFSIIVPCYNLAPWIGACLDSVLSQSYEDWECVVVDDASKDESAAILDGYAARDSRIKVIHQKNKGEGGARNTGITASKGEWIFFLDGDDVMAEGGLAALARLVDEHPQENLFRFGFEIFEDGRMWMPKSVVRQVNRKDISTAMSMDDYFTFVWQHLYRRETIEGLKFKRYKRGCDRVFVDDVLLNRVNSFVETSEVIYGYRQRSSSAVHAAPSVQVMFDEMDHRIDLARLVDLSKKWVPYGSCWWITHYFTFSLFNIIRDFSSQDRIKLWGHWLTASEQLANLKQMPRRFRCVFAVCNLLHSHLPAAVFGYFPHWYRLHSPVCRSIGALKRFFQH